MRHRSLGKTGARRNSASASVTQATRPKARIRGGRQLDKNRLRYPEVIMLRMQTTLPSQHWRPRIFPPFAKHRLYTSSQAYPAIPRSRNTTSNASLARESKIPTSTATRLPSGLCLQVRSPDGQASSPITSCLPSCRRTGQFTKTRWKFRQPSSSS